MEKYLKLIPDFDDLHKGFGKLNKEQNQLFQQADKLTSQYENFGQTLKEVTIRGARNFDALLAHEKKYVKQLDLVSNKHKVLLKGLRAIEKAKPYDGQQAAIQRMRNELEGSVKQVNRLSTAHGSLGKKGAQVLHKLKQDIASLDIRVVERDIDKVSNSMKDLQKRIDAQEKSWNANLRALQRQQTEYKQLENRIKAIGSVQLKDMGRLDLQQQKKEITSTKNELEKLRRSSALLDSEYHELNATLNRADKELNEFEQEARQTASTLNRTGRKVDQFGRRTQRTTRKVEEHEGVLENWAHRFGAVALGFTVAYRAMNAFENLMAKTSETIKEAIVSSGELASLQAQLATYAMIAEGAGESVEAFGGKMEQAAGNVREIANASLESTSTLNELRTAYDEFAQHGIMIQKELMDEFSAFVDFAALIAQTTGNTIKQIRSEISGLLEGQMRASNVVIRMLKRTGLITDELIAKIKGAEDVSEGMKEMLEKIGPILQEMQRYRLEVDVGAGWQKWQDAIRQAMVTSIQMRSEMEGTLNIFGEVINKHREQAIAMQDNEEAMRAYGEAMVGLRDLVDLAMKSYRVFIDNLLRAIGFVSKHRDLIVSLGEAYLGLLVVSRINSVFKIFLGTLKLLASPVTHLVGIFGRFVKVLSYVPVTLALVYTRLGNLVTTVKNFTTALGRSVKKILIHTSAIAATTAAVYGLSAAVRSLKLSVPEEFADNLGDAIDNIDNKIDELVSKGKQNKETMEQFLSLKETKKELEYLLKKREELGEEEFERLFANNLEEAYKNYQQAMSKDIPSFWERMKKTMEGDAGKVTELLYGTFEDAFERINKLFEEDDTISESVKKEALDIAKMMKDVEDILKDFDDVTTKFEKRLKEAISAGKGAKVEDLVPFAAEEVRLKISKITESIETLEEAQERVNEEEGKGAFKDVYPEKALMLEELNLQLEEQKNLLDYINDDAFDVTQATRWAEAVEKDALSVEEFKDKLSELKIDTDLGEEEIEELLESLTKKTKEAAEKVTNEVDKLYENMLENIQSEFADAIYEMLDGQLDSWDDFFDSIFDMFKKMVAQMAAVDVMKAIGLKTSGAGLSALGGIGEKLFGGGAGGAGGFGGVMSGASKLTGNLLGIDGSGFLSQETPFLSKAPGFGGISVGQTLGLAGGAFQAGSALEGGIDTVGQGASAVSGGLKMASAIPGPHSVFTFGASLALDLANALGVFEESVDDIDFEAGFGKTKDYILRGKEEAENYQQSLNENMPTFEAWEDAPGPSIDTSWKWGTDIAKREDTPEPSIDTSWEWGTDIVNFAKWEEQQGFGTRTYDFGRDVGKESTGEKAGRAFHEYLTRIVSGVNEALDVQLSEVFAQESLKINVDDPRKYFEEGAGGIQAMAEDVMVDFWDTYAGAIAEGMFTKGAAELLGTNEFKQHAQGIADETGQTLTDVFTSLYSEFERIPEFGERLVRLVEEEGFGVGEATEKLQAKYEEVTGILAPAIEAGLNASIESLDFADFQEGLTSNIEQQMQKAVLTAAKQSFTQDIIESAFDEVGDLSGIMEDYFAGDIGISELSSTFNDAMSKIEDAMDSEAYQEFANVIKELGLTIDETAEGMSRQTQKVIEGIENVIRKDTMSDYEYQIWQIDKAYENHKETLKEAGLWSEYAEKWQKAYNIELENAGEAAKDAFQSLKSDIRGIDFRKKEILNKYDFEKLFGASDLENIFTDIGEMSFEQIEDIAEGLEDTGVKEFINDLGYLANTIEDVGYAIDDIAQAEASLRTKMRETLDMEIPGSMQWEAMGYDPKSDVISSLGKDFLNVDTEEELLKKVERLINIEEFTGSDLNTIGNALINSLEENTETSKNGFDEICARLNKQADEWLKNFGLERKGTDLVDYEEPNKLEEEVSKVKETLADWREQIRDAADFQMKDTLTKDADPPWKDPVGEIWREGEKVEQRVIEKIREKFAKEWEKTFDRASSYIDQFLDDTNELTKQISDIDSHFEDYKQTLKEAGAGVEELTKLEEMRIKAIEEATEAYQQDILSRSQSMLYDLTGNKDILAEQLEVLNEQMADTEADNWGKQLDILQEQVSLLEKIKESSAEQIKQTIQSYESIQDTILRLQGGDLAAVQSFEFFERRYDQLLKEAQTGDQEAISDLNSFINKYADFMQAYTTEQGGGYKEFTQKVIGDLESLQDSLTDGATLDNLEQQLKEINENAYDGLPVDMESIKTHLKTIVEAMKSGVGVDSDLSSEEKFVSAMYENLFGRSADPAGLEYWAERLEEDAKVTVQNLAKYMIGAASDKDIENVPSYQTGGWHPGGPALVHGAELIDFPGPANISNKQETGGIIADAVREALGGGAGGEITVKVYLDGKELRGHTAQMIRTDPEVQTQIRRVAG